MKIKTVITLSDDVLAAVDCLSKTEGRSRSEIIEEAIRAHLQRQTRSDIAARDLEILDRVSDRLNEEVVDTLEYQIME